MYKGFWNKLPRPFYVLAPLANVTDAAFRRLVAKYGRPDVMFTEFVSADGLFLGGKEALMKDLIFSEEERPIVAQFFTSKPEMIERAARLAVELGFDGVDINMGCPDKSIEKQGAGAALMKNPELAREIICAAKQGAGSLPVSVKTRLGYNTNEIETWLTELLKAKPAAITIHARTRRELSKVSAHWDQIKYAVKIRNQLQLGGETSRLENTLIIGNGDVVNLSDAKEKAEETGADGIMLGKAIFGNPWLFARQSSFQHSQECRNDDREYVPTIKEKLNVMVEHTKLFEELLSHKNFNIMKKHYKAYVTGFDGAKELRIKLMGAKNGDEVALIVEKYLSTL